MKLARRILGVVLALLGGVWFFQGIGMIKGSFMTNDPTWTIIGAVVALAGMGLLAWPQRAPRP